MENLFNVSQILNKQLITLRSLSDDTGHSSVLEAKKSGVGRTLTSQKEDGIGKPIR